MNTKFRKKRIIVEAFQMTKARMDDNADWPEWVRAAWDLGFNRVGGLYAELNNPSSPRAPHERVKAHTLEGNMEVSVDDWLIRGAENEIYPCKPRIFAKTYEAVDG